jgi:AGZA family xanthine/uracil permease-like MFS transporter
MGTGRITYQQALTAVFVEGFIFILVSVVGVRAFLLSKMPKSLLLSTSAGIGLFLAHIGLQQGEGLGVVTYNSATLVTLGGCAPQYRQPQFTFGFGVPKPADVCAVVNGTLELTSAWVPSGNFACASAGVMRSPTMWLGIAGGMVMAILMARNVKGGKAPQPMTQRMIYTPAQYRD